MVGGILTNLLLLVVGAALLRRRLAAIRFARMTAFPITISAVIATTGFVIASNQQVSATSAAAGGVLNVSLWAVAAVWVAAALALAILLWLPRSESEAVGEWASQPTPKRGTVIVSATVLLAMTWST